MELGYSRIMLQLLRNALLVLRFRGALSALIRDCGQMAYHHLRWDLFVVSPAGVLCHSDRAVYNGTWDPQSRSWVGNG